VKDCHSGQRIYRIVHPICACEQQFDIALKPIAYFVRLSTCLKNINITYTQCWLLYHHNPFWFSECVQISGQ